MLRGSKPADDQRTQHPPLTHNLPFPGGLWIPESDYGRDIRGMMGNRHRGVLPLPNGHPTHDFNGLSLTDNAIHTTTSRHSHQRPSSSINCA